MGNLNFNPAEVVQDDAGYDPIPAGDYEMQVIDSELKPTKAKNGTILKLTCEVVTGNYTKRLVWDNLNVQNPNAQAEDISKKMLGKLAEAVGLNFVGDHEDLRFKPFKARIAIRPAEGIYDAQNVIKKYMPLDGRVPMAQAVHSIAETLPQNGQPVVVAPKRWAPPKPRI